jgi:hypothetical protein
MTIFRKTTAMLLIAMLPLSVGVASASSTTTPTTANLVSGDVAKMYRVQHELKLELKGTKGLLDGKAITVDQPILRDGRVYVPIRTLQQSGAASIVEWNAVRREVRVVMNPRIRATFEEIRYRIGSDMVYAADGTAFENEKIPVPFISGGRTYVPIRPLNTYQSIAVSLNNGVVSWNWSEKIIEVYQREWSTDEAQTTFTMLYQKDMYTPQFMSAFGAGGWWGSSDTREIIEKDIQLDGRLYNRIRFTADLKPGINPLMLTAVSAGEERIEVTRNVSDPTSIPIMLPEDDIVYTKLTEPSQGYFKLKSGESLTIAGEIIRQNELFDEVTLAADEYDPSLKQFKESFSVKALIKDNKYAGELTFERPGSYWVNLISPKYLRSIDVGPYSTIWASIIVDVE